ncbi:MAG: hypothetical protein AAFW73_08045 [Bacteroidota bacterium]
MEHKDSLLGVIQTLFKWKKQIFYVCAIAAVGSVIIALLLPDYYESSTIFYAASPDLAKPEGVGPIEKDKEYYGESEDQDRVLTICESSKIAERLIQKYNLYAHYDIDSTHKRAPYKVRRTLAKLYTVVKTKYDAIEITVEDKDPQVAMNMVNDAREMVNELGQSLIKNSQLQAIAKQEKQLNEQRRNLRALGDSLANLRRAYGIYNTVSQSELFAELLAKSESRLTRTRARLTQFKSNKRTPRDTLLKLQSNIAGYEEEVKSLQSRIEHFNKGMSVIDAMEQEHKEARDQTGLDNERLKQFKAAYQTPFTAIYLIEPGELPIVKSRPVRSVLVVASVFIAFVFSIIGVLLLETYRDVNWKEIIHAK